MVMKTRNGLISDFKSKLKMEEKSNGNEIKCDQCDKVLSKEKDLERHNKNFHLKIEDLVCEVCKKAFANYKKLRIHKQVHMERMFPCDICVLKIKTKGKQTADTWDFQRNHTFVQIVEFTFPIQIINSNTWTSQSGKNLLVTPVESSLAGIQI